MFDEGSPWTGEDPHGVWRDREYDHERGAVDTALREGRARDPASVEELLPEVFWSRLISVDLEWKLQMKQEESDQQENERDL